MKKRNTPENSSIAEVMAMLKDCHNNHIPVVGKLVEYDGRSGFIVNIDGVRAFLHKSELSYAYISDFESYVGKTLIFLITTFDISSNRIIVSRKEYVNDLHKGSIVFGVVTEILENRIHLDAGFKAYVHIRNMSDGFVSNIKAMFSIGDTVEIALMEDCTHKGFTECTSKSSRLWEAKTEKIALEDIVMASVTEVVDNGLRMTINDTIDGFIPIGILSKELKQRFDADNIYIGEQFEVAITRIDNDKRRLMVSVNQVSQIREKQSIDNLKNIIQRGTLLEGCVQAVNKRFAEVLLVGTDIVVKIDRDHLSENKVVDAREEVFEGQVLPVLYLGESDGKLIFSRKQLTTSIYSPEIYDLTLEELLAKQGIDKNLFVGKAVTMGDDLFFHNVASVGSKFDGESFFEGRLLQDYITARPSIVLVKNKNWASELVENEYYQFSIALAPKQTRLSQGSPFIYQTAYNTIIKHIDNPYKLAVDRVFSKQESPEQNKIIASLLREVGSQLYSEKSRMLFELLQNADDAAPSRNQEKESEAPHVQVAIDITKDGIIFRHNGCAFNFEDFYSITSAANSTKGVKKRSTGYKGIGFKSVFTNSKSVFILSQGFKFGFDRNNPIFEVSRFDDLYRKIRSFSSEQEERNFFVKYAEQRSGYRGIDDIPWQIMPFWSNEVLPSNLLHSNKNDNVVIGLNMDSLSRDEYQTAIEEVFNNPRMFLFLRNTRRLQFSGLDESSPITIQKDYDSKNNIIRLASSYGHSEQETYRIINSSDIEISDKAFEKAGVGIRIKCEEKNGIEEYSFVEVYNDIEGKKVSNIPDKIASANSTSISIAFNVDENGRIVPIKTNNIQSSLYAYLPMNEQRFKFPFFINADFVLSSSREGLQADNKWNIFLFHEIGKMVVSAVCEIANINNPEYLRLLPGIFVADKASTCAIASAFNDSYIEALHTDKFIVDDSNELRSQDEILLDNTGLADIIGNELYLKVIGSSKHLPHHLLNTSPLHQEIFDGVETIDFGTLNNLLINQDTISILNNWLNDENTDRTAVNSLFQWLIKEEDLDAATIIDNLKIIHLNGVTVSLNDIKENETTLLLSSDTYEVRDILIKLGLSCNTADLTDHPLSEYIDLYLSDNQEVYDRLSKLDLSVLSYQERLRLFRSMEKWDNIGETRLKKIPIFKSVLGSLIPFEDAYIVSNRLNGIELPEWYNRHIMSKDELCLGLTKYLPDSIKECFDKAFTILLKDKFTSYTEFYNFFKDDALWSDSNTIQIIDQEGCTIETLLLAKIGYAAGKTKFINTLENLNLSSESDYPKESFEYNVIALALENNLSTELRQKTYIDGIPLSQYALSDGVTFNVSGAIYQLSLSEVLPDFSTENSLGRVKQKFSSIPLINDLFVQKEIDKEVLRSKFKTYLAQGSRILNWAQISYIALEKLCNFNWGSYRNNMKIPTGKDLMDILNPLVENNCNKLFSTFLSSVTYYQVVEIKGKYFDSDKYTLTEERVPSYIAEWIKDEATHEKRTALLIELGAYSSSSNEIKRRKKFIGESSVDADWGISGSAIVSFCNWVIKTQDLSVLSQKQKEIIRILSEKAPKVIIKDFDLPRLEEAREYDDECYKLWNKSSAISIYLINGDIPRVYKFNNTVLLRFEEGSVDYVDAKKIIYVNANNDIESEMMTMAGKYGVPFTKVNWQELFSVNRSALKREQEENARLRRKLQDMEDEQSENGGRKLKRQDADDETQKELNREARVRAKAYLLERGYNCQDWDIDQPKKVYETTKNSKAIRFVIASSRGGQIYLHPYKFAVIMENPENLLLVYDGKKIRGLSFEEAFKGNHDVNLVFDVDFVTPEKMAEIANEMQFYPKANFVIENPDYSISDELRTFGLNEKHEGTAPTGFSDDEIFG